MHRLAVVALFVLVLAGAADARIITGVVVTKAGEVVPGATVTAETSGGLIDATSGSDGGFRLDIGDAVSATVRVSGRFITAQSQTIDSDQTQPLVFRISYAIPQRHESLVISATAEEPSVDRRNEAVYKHTLFGRDDQIFDTLAAGINAGQHEGGGKSIEVRRFGFNLDHGGVSGGLKVLVDDVQQNQSTQGHGQGYLGGLKSLTPELVQDVEIINGPFRAEYGDFSGLGVVHIRMKEELADKVTLRIQGGSFGNVRGFGAWSPKLKNADGFVAYESAFTDGPFVNPLGYRRDNVSANYTRHVSPNQDLGFKLNFGRNVYDSSGQIPLDEVANGALDRFGYVDPDNGGDVRNGTAGVYYRRSFANGDMLKLDGFVARSLFDLWSNFTFYLTDPLRGDEIQQHDSRLQEGLNAQYLHAWSLWGRPALLTAGANYHDNQINVSLLNTENREAFAISTAANARVANGAGYIQQAVEVIPGRLRFDAGLRYDYFRFSVRDRVIPELSGLDHAGRLQPKFNMAWTPSMRVPATLHFSYGRGISSQDARGVVQYPDGPKLATTDFYQIGTSHNLKRLSLSTDLFLIDRSNEQVYIPDDGSIEFRGPSRAYGFETKASIQVISKLALNGGFTRVGNVFYRGTAPRVYVDSAPHLVSNLGVTISGWRGFNASARYRHISDYRLDGLDAAIQASGLNVVDLSISKELRHRVEFNFGIDNLTNDTYWETQNYFASRLTPTSPVIARVHGTPGYPRSFTVGLTFRLGEN